jgi:hypothetical protein
MFKKRKQQEIALAVVDEIAKNLGGPVVGAPDFLLGIFRDVCVRSDFAPTERDARRIFQRIQHEITLRQLKALTG